MIITPICAHTLAVRPVVVPARCDHRASSRCRPAPRTCWSRSTASSAPPSPRATGSTSAAPGRSVLLVRLGAEGYFTRMRQKLHWGDLSEREVDPMIAELRVRDLATIADVTLQLGPGLNVLTGETGAGKSMLVDAARAAARRPGRQRHGAPRRRRARSSKAPSRCRTPALRRRLEALGLDARGRPRWSSAARSAPKGAPAPGSTAAPTTVGVLGRARRLLVDLHGQHETQSLLQPDAQRDILDAFAGAGAGARRAWPRPHDALSALRGEEAALVAAAGRGAPPGRLPAPRGRRRSTPPEARGRRGRALDARGHAGWPTRAPWRSRRGGSATLLDGDDGGALRRARRRPTGLLGGLERVDPAGRRVAGAARRGLRQPERAGPPGRRPTPTELRGGSRRGWRRSSGGATCSTGSSRSTAPRSTAVLGPAPRPPRSSTCSTPPTLDLPAARRPAAWPPKAAAEAAADAPQRKRRTEAARPAGPRAVTRLLPQARARRAASSRSTLTPLGRIEPGGAGGGDLHGAAQRRPRAAAARQGGVGRRTVAAHAGAQGGAGAARRGSRPWCSTRSTRESAARSAARWAQALAEVAARHQVLVITHLPQIAARADRHLVVSKAREARRRHQRRAADPRRGPGHRDRPDAGRRGRCDRAAARGGAARAIVRLARFPRCHSRVPGCPRAPVLPFSRLPVSRSTDFPLPSQHFTNARQPLRPVADHLDRDHDRHREHRAGHAPDPPPEDEPEEDRQRVEREPAPEQVGRDKIRLQRVHRQVMPPVRAAPGPAGRS